MSKQILIVDDTQTMREMVEFTLKQAGFSVSKAEDGQKGLEQAKTAQFDAVITDLNMPNMNGFELIRALRDMGNYKFTPILMLTTESDDSKKAEGKAAGATGWIVKPFSPEKLVSVVNKVTAA